MALSNHAKIGLFTVIAILVLAMLITWKSEILMLKEGYTLTGSFNNIEGLTQGSEVRYRGLRVGKITDIDPGIDDIKIYSTISRRIKIPIDSVLRVAYDGIVGQKYLEIKPGISTEMYKPGQVIFGVKTAGIVDFVDIGSQNLEETKKILSNIRTIIEDPRIQAAFMNTVFTAEKITTDIEKLTEELRQTNAGIRAIVADPQFQDNVKGTISETNKTLSSANKFFDSMGKINVRASAGVDVGSRANTVIGDVDIIQNESSYLRLGVGEGQTTRQPGLLDVLFNSMANDKLGYRLGIINNQIGGGLLYFPSDTNMLTGDLYDINNPRPSNPKIRLGFEHALEDYMNVTFKGDDLLNSGNRNITVGIKVKAPSKKIY